MPEKNLGLIDKYSVKRTDNKAMGPSFTLEYTRDPFAFFALCAYAGALASYPHFALLKADLDAITADINVNGLDCRLDCPKCGAKHVDGIEMPRHTEHVCHSCFHPWTPCFPFPTRGIEK